MSLVNSTPKLQPPVPPPFILGNNSHYEFTSKQIQLNECTWAVDYPEVQKACYLARVCTITAPKCCRFKNVSSILQDGPTCGLTVVSMLLGGDPTLKELLELAKDKNYTRNGEMFCGQNLYKLICEVLEKRQSTMQCILHKGCLNCDTVKESLTKGSCIFVPYDPDFNHGPCLKMGHKAHWALLVGYLVDQDGKFYVFARHGKSRNIAIWPLKSLSLSNANLYEFAQPKGYPDMEFLLPEGGIGGELGLRNRAVIVEGVDVEETVII